MTDLPDETPSPGQGSDDPRTTRRMRSVQAPMIPLVAEWIRRREGTISLGQGVVSYGPPPPAFERLKDFGTDQSHHRYQSVAGVPELREALTRKLERENGAVMDERRYLMVTAGANMGFVNALLAVADVGDEIILLTPYYFNHEMAVTMAGCRPVLVATDADYQPVPEAVASAITDRTRAVVTISPNNPTGAVYPRATLEQIQDLCAARDIYHIHDETYEYFIHGATPHYSPVSRTADAARTIGLYSLSKAYGFASWRIGYMVAPRHLQVSLEKIQDTILICPPVISQYAALGALSAGREYCRSRIEKLGQVRQCVLRSLEAISDLCEVPPAEGAFYVLLRLKAPHDSVALTRRLIERHGVAVMPGAAFGIGDPCCLRVAYGALDAATVEAGMARLTSGLRDLAESGIVRPRS